MAPSSSPYSRRFGGRRDHERHGAGEYNAHRDGHETYSHESHYEVVRYDDARDVVAYDISTVSLALGKRGPGRIGPLQATAFIAFGLTLFAGVASIAYTIGQDQTRKTQSEIRLASIDARPIAPETSSFDTVITKTALLRGSLGDAPARTRYRGPQRVRLARKSDFALERWRVTIAALRRNNLETTPADNVREASLRVVPARGHSPTAHNFSVTAVPKPRILSASIRRQLGEKRRHFAASKHCLAQAIYFEARSEPTVGQVAVANVVMNRVKSSKYPNTVCGVVFQNYQNRNACQFSFACDGRPEKTKDRKSWRHAIKLADGIMTGTRKFRPVRNATHYHADYVRPDWSRQFKKIKKIGRHIFYWNTKIKPTSG